MCSLYLFVQRVGSTWIFQWETSNNSRVLSLLGSPNQKVKNCHYRQFSSEELKFKQLVYAAEMDEPQHEMSSAEISDASDTKLTLDSGE